MNKFDKGLNSPILIGFKKVCALLQMEWTIKIQKAPVLFIACCE